MKHVNTRILKFGCLLLLSVTTYCHAVDVERLYGDRPKASSANTEIERLPKAPTAAQETGSQAATPATKSTNRWMIHKGDKLSEVIGNWCKNNQWTLYWEAPEVIAEADLTLTGELEPIVAMIIDAVNRNNSGLNLRPMLYKDNSPIVLRITERKS